MRLATTDGRFVQFPSFLGRQISQDFFAFIQAQPLQEPDLLHLQHAIVSASHQEPSFLVGTAIGMGINSAMNIQITKQIGGGVNERSYYWGEPERAPH